MASFLGWKTILTVHLLVVADTSLLGLRVDRELVRLIAERGKPRTIVGDNGSELTGNAGWTDQARVE